MFTKINVEKTLFKNQYHEGYQFELNHKGKQFRGLFQNGEIKWFNPQPLHYIKEKQLDKVESKVRKKLKKHI
ncbi:hypothetical protein [Bacillus sp. FJAT-27245]|uniref:hypothetical protein n=1 Tax=Bacillus sp. FJAT-27245 TaxID=1684144 RepID=UPI0006A7DB79|nr:hypothetical protein [Bacillus sp. FJAT-27245]